MRRCLSICSNFIYDQESFGEVAEWSKAVDSKSTERLKGAPWVRIPPSPPVCKIIVTKGYFHPPGPFLREKEKRGYILI